MAQRPSDYILLVIRVMIWIQQIVLNQFYLPDGSTSVGGGVCFPSVSSFVRQDDERKACWSVLLLSSPATQHTENSTDVPTTAILSHVLMCVVKMSGIVDIAC